MPASPQIAARFRAFWLYSLLIIGSAVFMWPFLWMGTASVKVERELFSEDAGLIPQSPAIPSVSPFLERRTHAGFKHPQLAEQQPRLEATLRDRGLVWPEGIDADAARAELARGLFHRLARLAPESWWALPPDDLAAKLNGLLTPAMIETERAGILRGVVLGKLILLSYDLQENVAIAPDAVASAWTLGGDANAHFGTDPAAKTQGSLLAYDFSKGDHATLTTTMQAGFPLDRLHRIQLFVRPDDSWHALECTVEMNGHRYRAERASTLYDTGWLSLSWQLPGPDDLTNQQKTWTLLREVDPSATESLGAAPESAPGRIKLTLELRRRGFIGAWWAKITRNYHTVLEYIPFGRYVATSLFLVILQVVGTIFSCSLVAYSFSRLRWPGRGACFMIMLGTMMLPGQVTMIPYFLIIRDLGWYNTLYPLWVPSLFANAFFVFLLCQFMRGIPRDLEDAARIDGCGVLRIYWHVMMPLLRPSLAAIGIFTFMGVWNDFMGPLIYLQDQRLYPLSLGLYALNVQNVQGSNSMGMMMAGSLLMTLPVVAIFFFAQRYFIKGITMTGMKG
ncbi:MAG: carbohydrate ABC transporter permease [Verrucomicrobia bacterium]|nr:carbohydrate ABC transporter permease [Verrucomicrobiota bacterium]